MRDLRHVSVNRPLISFTVPGSCCFPNNCHSLGPKRQWIECSKDDGEAHTGSAHWTLAEGCFIIILEVANNNVLESHIKDNDWMQNKMRSVI